MKNRIMNYQRHNGKWCIGTCIGLEYKYELNSKTENAQKINIKLRKIYDTKARNNKSNKRTTRSDDNYGKTRLRQNL